MSSLPAEPQRHPANNGGVILRRIKKEKKKACKNLI